MAGVENGPGIKSHRLELSSNEIRRIFEPVVSEILSVIREQIKETKEKVKLILLVGGFGDSIYLQSRIQKEFGAGIEVKVSPDRYVLAYPTL